MVPGLLDPTQPYFSSDLPGWKVVTVGWTAFAAMIISLLLMRHAFQERKPALIYVCVCFWAIVPPVWFWWEFTYLYRVYGVPGSLDLFKEHQQSCMAIWLGILAFHAVVATNGRFHTPLPPLPRRSSGGSFAIGSRVGTSGLRLPDLEDLAPFDAPASTTAGEPALRRNTARAAHELAPRPAPRPPVQEAPPPPPVQEAPSPAPPVQEAPPPPPPVQEAPPPPPVQEAPSPAPPVQEAPSPPPGSFGPGPSA